MSVLQHLNFLIILLRVVVRRFLLVKLVKVSFDILIKSVRVWRYFFIKSILFHHEIVVSKAVLKRASFFNLLEAGEVGILVQLVPIFPG